MNFVQRERARLFFALASLVIFTIAARLAAAARWEFDDTFRIGIGVANSNGTPGVVRCVAIQADGKILIGGGFELVNGMPQGHLARLNLDGSLDETFRPDVTTGGYSTSFGGEKVLALAVQPDGKILIGGIFLGVNGVTLTNIARLQASGQVDPDFHPPSLPTIHGSTVVTKIAIQPDGKILAVGSFGVNNNSAPGSVIRLNANGARDTSFVALAQRYYIGDYEPGIMNAVAVQTDGKVLLGGLFTALEPKMFAAARFGGLARTLADGIPDDSFVPVDFGLMKVPITFGTRLDPTNGVTGLTLQNDGKILVGHVPTVAASASGGLNRLLDTGADDPAFTPPVFDSPVRAATLTALAVQGNGQILMGGFFQRVNQQPREAIARVNADGTLDGWMALPAASTNLDGSKVYVSSDGHSGPGGIDALAVQADGRVLVGGSFTNLAGVVRYGITRLNTVPPAPPLLSPALLAGNFSVSVATLSDLSYTLEATDALDHLPWAVVARVNGDGTIKTFQDTNTTSHARFYRVKPGTSAP